MEENESQECPFFCCSKEIYFHHLDGACDYRLEVQYFVLVKSRALSQLRKQYYGFLLMGYNSNITCNAVINWIFNTARGALLYSKG